MKTFSSVILGAGKGTRLALDEAKPLVKAKGKCLIDYVIEGVDSFYKLDNLKGSINVVTGHQREQVETHVKEKFQGDLNFAFQKEQKGTADAILSYLDEVKNHNEFEYTLILCADTPLVRGEALSSLFNAMIEHELDGVAATFNAHNPYGYGRIVHSEEGGFQIVEEKDATDEQREISEVNSGLYIVKTSYLLEHINNIGSDNKSGEFYLTDLFGPGRNIAACLFDNPDIFLGINTLEQLETAEFLLNLEKLDELRNSGVRLKDANSIFIDSDVEIGAGSTIYPGVSIYGNSKLGKNVEIKNGCIIENSQIEDGVELKSYSVLEEAIVRNNAIVGPFARLRPLADIGAESKIGNFVEIKKSKLEKGVKVSHLSYVGDAEIGENTNIGCGFVSVNYDGINKSKTKIGKNSFIGSGTNLIAPIEVGDESFVAAGSTLNKSVDSGDFSIARSRQENKIGLAKKFLKKK